MRPTALGRALFMSRTNRAAISAAFTYLQFAISMLFGLIVIKITLARVGSREYGLWLASGEILGYAGLLDIGVFSLLPWLIAKADGEGDRAAMRSYVKHAVYIGIAVSISYAVFFTLCWTVLPGLLKLSATDRVVLRAPLFLLVSAVALTYPFKVLDAVLLGIQDVRFTGMLSLTQLLTTSIVELGMLYLGFGLISLAVASALNVIIAGSLGLWRVHRIAPDLLRNWPPFHWATLRFFMGDGTGVWVGSVGVQIMAASAGLILASMQRPELTPLYAVTTKLALIITQMCWVLPDSGLVGLAQLHGSSDRDRVPGVVMRMLEFHLLLSTAAASMILSFNPSFVRVWVRRRIFCRIRIQHRVGSAHRRVFGHARFDLLHCRARRPQKNRHPHDLASGRPIRRCDLIYAMVRLSRTAAGSADRSARRAADLHAAAAPKTDRTGYCETITRLVSHRRPARHSRAYIGLVFRHVSFGLVPLASVFAVQLVMASIAILLLWPMLQIILEDPRVKGVLSSIRLWRIMPSRV